MTLVSRPLTLGLILLCAVTGAIGGLLVVYLLQELQVGQGSRNNLVLNTHDPPENCAPGRENRSSYFPFSIMGEDYSQNECEIALRPRVDELSILNQTQNLLIQNRFEQAAVELEKIGSTSQWTQEAEYLWDDFFAQVRVHYAQKGEIEKVALWLQKIPQWTSVYPRAMNWIAAEEVEWQNNIEQQTKANQARQEGHFDDAVQYQNTMVPSTPFWTQQIADMESAIAQDQQYFQNLINACETDRQNYQNGDVATINRINFGKDIAYRETCHRVGVVLPPREAAFDIAMGDVSICLVATQTDSLLLRWEPEISSMFIKPLQNGMLLSRMDWLSARRNAGYLWIPVDTGLETGWIAAFNLETEALYVQGCLRREEVLASR